MKRIYIIVISVIMIPFSYFVCAQQNPIQVKLKENVDETMFLTINAQNERTILVGDEILTLIPSFPNAKTQELCLFYDIQDYQEAEDMLQVKLRRTSLFDEITVSETVYPTICTNPLPPINDAKITNGSIDNYALNIINANCAWSITKGKPGILIGICDTDFDITHEDLVNQFVRVTGPISDGHIHGTCVSGVACAEVNNNKGIAGIGYNSKIAAYRIKHVVTSDGNCTAFSSDIKTAIWNAYLDGCPIINVSWAGTGLNALAAKEITQNGSTIVLGAGNDSVNVYHGTIANIPGVIVVSGSNSNDEYHVKHARSQYIDLCAPSSLVAITVPGNTYWNSNGTSYAAPLVSGTIALMLAVNPCLSPAEIETILKETTAPLNNAHLYTGLIGTGRLDAYEAVKKVLDSGTKYIQNKTYNATTVEVASTAIRVGNAVTSTLPYGNVVINTGKRVTFRATNFIELTPGFEVQSGGTFEMNIYQSNCY